VVSARRNDHSIGHPVCCGRHAGTLPLIVDGKCVGAIGVSGDTPQVDGDIAEAGVAVF
jgi:uncharacterized protein GlcG (DUF336 family)